jgi:hypothetical protein
VVKAAAADLSLNNKGPPKIDMIKSVASSAVAAAAAAINLCKVGNQTSSVDPQAVNARVFVGNLNTFQVTKTDVEKVFQRYGRIAGK